MLVRRVWPSRPTFDSPFAELEQMRREMLRLFDSAATGDLMSQTAGVFPPMNITQDNDSFHVRAEIPGVKADEIGITAVRNRLTIQGKREIPQENGKVSWHRKERAEGTFSRTITLPSEIDAEKVDARYADGVLSLVLPKAESAKPRQITVKS
jgi:HSP20 family protein